MQAYGKKRYGIKRNSEFVFVDLRNRNFFYHVYMFNAIFQVNIANLFKPN